jgi:hypothetical protein
MRLSYFLTKSGSMNTKWIKFIRHSAYIVTKYKEEKKRHLVTKWSGFIESLNWLIDKIFFQHQKINISA